MHSEVRHGPAFATLFVGLQPGDRIIAESDAMASMGPRVQMRTRLNGNFFEALLRRLFGGESFFVNEFSVPGGQADDSVVLTQRTPGDLRTIELNGSTLYLQPGAFVAAEPTVDLGVGWAGFASWIGGEGLLRLSVGGRGRVWVGAYGGLFDDDVQEELVVDTGHLVAYEPTVSLNVGLAGGLFSSFFSGEGLITRVKGRGRVLLQSRSIDGLAAWVNAHLW